LQCSLYTQQDAYILFALDNKDYKANSTPASLLARQASTTTETSSNDKEAFGSETVLATLNTIQTYLHLFYSPNVFLSPLIDITDDHRAGWTF